MATITKYLSFEYFWAWAIPTVVILQYFSNSPLNEFEVMNSLILITVWTAAYPKLVVDYLCKKYLKLKWPLLIMYWSSFGYILNSTITYFIQL